ncbi:MAG TPA: PLDc N-terminal domain-containing protein [Ktedonobacteraceae bacterium]|jgi:hypothetical protein
MRSERGCFFNSLLFLLIVFLPLVGHIIETVMVLQDDHSAPGMLGWLLVIWLIPFLGPLLYLLFGQRRTHIYFGQPAYPSPYEQQIYQQQRQTY